MLLCRSMLSRLLASTLVAFLPLTLTTATRSGKATGATAAAISSLLSISHGDALS